VPLSLPSAGKVLPPYVDQSSKPTIVPTQASALADLSSAQQVRRTSAQQISNQAAFPSDLSLANTFGPSPMTSVTTDVYTAVSSLAKLAEPSAAGDIVDHIEPAKTDLGHAARQLLSEAVAVESTSVSAATPDVVDPSVVVSQHGLKALGSPEQVVLPSVLPTSESTTVSLTVTSTVLPSQSGVGLFGKPALPTSSVTTQVTASGSFVFGQSSAMSTTSNLTVPPLSNSGPSLAGPSPDPQTVSSSTSDSGQTAAVTVVGDAVSTTTSTSPADAAVPATCSEQTTVPTAAVDTVAQSVAAVTTTLTTSSENTAGTAPDMTFGKLSVTVAASASVGTVSFVAPTTSSVTGSEQLPSSGAGVAVATSSAPATVLSQPSEAVASTYGTAIFGGPALTSATSSAPSLFGVPATTSASMTPFGQQLSSGSSLFGQPTSAPAPAAPASSFSNIFGQPSTAVSSTPSTGVFGVFGQPTSSTAAGGGFKPFGFAASSSSGFAQPPVFGQSAFGQSAFGPTTSRYVYFILGLYRILSPVRLFSQHHYS